MQDKKTIHVFSNSIAISSLVSCSLQDIILTNGTFLRELAIKKFKKNKVVEAAGKKGLFIYFFFLLYAKLFNIKIICYHEASNQLFDFWWLVLKPKVIRKTYYNLEGYEKLEFSDMPPSLYKRLITICRLYDKFEYFWSHADYQCVDYFYKVKSDNCFLEQFPKKRLRALKKPYLEKSVLILLGSDCVATPKMIEIINIVIDWCVKNSIRVSLKDHPNPTYRIIDKALVKTIGDAVEVLEPLSSSEDIIFNYSLAIGFSSSSLLHASKSLCLLPMFGINAAINQKINYLKMQPDFDDSKLLFVDSKALLLNILERAL